jgi:pimeloyl-ACP methyl ester carboxylesterase
MRRRGVKTPRRHCPHPQSLCCVGPRSPAAGHQRYGASDSASDTQPCEPFFYPLPERRRFCGGTNSQLTRLPIEVNSLYLDTPAGCTHVLASGPEEAAPVGVLHGMNMNAAAMTEGLRILARHHRVYAVDIIGMPGKRPEPGCHAEAKVIHAGWKPCWTPWKSTLPLCRRLFRRVGGAHRPTADNGIRAAKPFFAPGTEPDSRFAELLALGYRHTRLDIDPRGLPVLSDPELSKLRRPAFVSYGGYDVFFNVERALTRARAVLPGLVMSEVVAGEGHVKTHDAEQRLFERISAFLRQHAT